MKKSTTVILVSILAVSFSLAACGKKSATSAPSTAGTPATPGAKSHALKGVIVDVVAAQHSLLVKHDDIPGLMPAMTMLFRVDDATLAAAKKDQAITGVLVERDGTYWLEQVKATASAGEKSDAR